MKHIIVAIAVALATRAHAQPLVTSAVEVAAFNWRTNSTEEFATADGRVGVRLKPGVSIPPDIVASLKSAKAADIGGSGVYILTEVAKGGDEVAATKLEEISDDAKASARVRRQAAGSVAATVPKNKARAKKMLDKLGPTNDGARAAFAAAAKLGDQTVLDEFLVTSKGKGITDPSYQKWFRSHVAGMETQQRRLALQNEVMGIESSTEDITSARAWIEELRIRLQLQKEAAQ